MLKTKDKKHPKRRYKKIWWGNGWHFIYDHTNRWLVMGRRVEKSRPFQRLRLGPVDLLISAIEDRRGGKSSAATDIWLRFTYWRWRQQRA